MIISKLYFIVPNTQEKLRKHESYARFFLNFQAFSDSSKCWIVFMSVRSKALAP